MNTIVQEHYSEQVLKDACALYNITYKAAKLIRANSNLIFDAGDKILRLSHSEIRTHKDIEAELAFLRFLQIKNLAVVQIVPSQQNNLWELLGTPDNHFSVVCFEKIDGTKVEKDAWTEQHSYNLGVLTAQLHQAEQSFEVPPNIIYKKWDELPEYDLYQHLPKDERQLTELHHQLVEQFKAYSIHSKNYGLIHYDIHSGNYLIDAQTQKLVLFDFEMVCYGWYAMDVAMVVYYAILHLNPNNPEAFEKDFLNLFWKGYETIYQLEDKDKAPIPAFVLYRDLMLYGYFNRTWADPKQAENEKIFREQTAQSIERRRMFLGC